MCALREFVTLVGMLTHDYRYETCLQGSITHAWTVDDCFQGRDFDFSKPFLP